MIPIVLYIDEYSKFDHRVVSTILLSLGRWIVCQRPVSLTCLGLVGGRYRRAMNIWCLGTSLVRAHVRFAIHIRGIDGKTKGRGFKSKRSYYQPPVIRLMLLEKCLKSWPESEAT
jgi:hypothetical protein